MKSYEELMEQVAKEYRAKHPDKEIDIVCMDRRYWNNDDEFADETYKRMIERIKETHQYIGDGLYARIKD